MIDWAGTVGRFPRWLMQGATLEVSALGGMIARNAPACQGGSRCNAGDGGPHQWVARALRTASWPHTGCLRRFGACRTKAEDHQRATGDGFGRWAVMAGQRAAACDHAQVCCAHIEMICHRRCAARNRKTDDPIVQLASQTRERSVP